MARNGSIERATVAFVTPHATDITTTGAKD